MVTAIVSLIVIVGAIFSAGVAVGRASMAHNDIFIGF